MKKNCLLLMLMFLAKLVNGQITFQSSDLPVPNSVLIAIDDTTTIFSAPSTGANQTWDYSTTLKQKTDSTKLVAYTPPANSAYLGATMISKGYGTATISGYSSSSFSIPSNSYLFTNSKGLFVKGFSLSGTELAPYLKDTNLVFNPALAIMRTPITYSSYITDSSKNTTSYSYFGFNTTTVSHFKTTFTGVGFGTIKTPEGTFTNTLLVKFHTISYSEDAPGDITSNTSFVWLQKDNRVPFVFTLAMNSNETSSQNSTYYKKSTQIITSFNNSEKEPLIGLKQYPVPCDEALYIDIQKNTSKVELLIFRIDGLLIEQKSYSNESLFKVNTSAYSSGSYFYQIRTSQETYPVNKFTVSH